MIVKQVHFQDLQVTPEMPKKNRKKGISPWGNNLIRMEKLFQVSLAEHSVPVICYVSSIHNLTKQVTEVLPWNFAIGLQVIIENIHTDGEVSYMTKRDDMLNIMHNNLIYLFAMLSTQVLE